MAISPDRVHVAELRDVQGHQLAQLDVVGDHAGELRVAARVLLEQVALVIDADVVGLVQVA